MQDTENNEIVVNEDLEQIDETAASDTLRPGAGSGGTESKAATLADFTQLLSTIPVEDLTKLHAAVQAQFGPNGAPGEVDNSGKNKASIKSAGAPGMPMPKLGVKEDVEEMFGADEDLTEDFKERAEVIFEAALNTRLTLETAKLQEAFEQRETELQEAFEVALEEKATEIFEDVTEKLNQYLDYAVAEWIEENKVAIDNGLRAEIAEGFIQGLHTLFTEHYIKVPETELDVMAEMKAEIDALSAKLDESIDENIQLKSLVNEATKEAVIDEMAEGMVLTQAEKLRSLAESIDFTDETTYRKRVSILKENYFAAPKATPNTGLMTEEVSKPEDNAVVSAEIDAVMAAISKSAKK